MSRPSLQAAASFAQQPADERRRKQRETRRETLVDAAICAIARHGPGVSMAEMAAEAGVTKPILYRYFADRRALVSAVTLRYLGELGIELATVPENLPLRDRTRRQFEVGLAYLERRPGLLMFIERERGFAVSAEREGEHADWLVDLVRSLVVARGLDARLAAPLAHGIGGMILGTTVSWLRSRENRPEEAMPLESMASAVTELIFAGLEGVLGA